MGRSSNRKHKPKRSKDFVYNDITTPKQRSPQVEAQPDNTKPEQRPESEPGEDVVICHPERTDALACELMDDDLEAADQAADEQLMKLIQRNAKLEANLSVRNKLEKKDNRIQELLRINADLEAQIRSHPQTLKKQKRQAASAATATVPAKPVSDIKTVRKSTGKMAVKDLHKKLDGSGVNVLHHPADSSSDEDGEFELSDNSDIESVVSLPPAPIKPSTRQNDSAPAKPSSILWPNDFLGFQHTKSFKDVKYSSLDMRKFILGELQILNSGGLTEADQQGRLKWLSEILTFAGDFEWNAVLRVHHTVLTQINKRLASWEDDLHRIAYPILIPCPLKSKDKVFADRAPRDKPNKVFCNKYNSDEGCTKEERHKMQFFDKEVVAHHFCSSCYKKDKIEREHSAKSKDCPHF